MESKQRPSLDDGISTTSSIIRRMTTHSASQRRLRRNSGPSSPVPTIAPPVAEVPPSCVARETLENECGLHRFIVWAAVKRNSCSQMTAEERRECPLLRCRKRFANHELMLQHLYTCDQLAAAEYWCYDCGKVERFNDAKCRRCLGHPSKRRKIVSMARNFFSSLGHRNRHGHLADLDLDMDDAPPSYDSILEPPQTELSSNEIHEMGATDRTCATLAGNEEATATADTPPETDGQSHLEPVIEPPSPLDTTPPAHPIVVTPIPVPPVELDSVSIEDALINWEPSPTPPLRASLGSPFQLSPTRTPDKPVLQLHTSGLGQYRPKTTTTTTTTGRSKTLAPSSSVRSTCSTASNQSVVSTTSYEVTPMSAWSGTWDRVAGFESTQTSPDDVINMDDLVPSASFANIAKMETVKEKCGEYDAGDGFLAELPADLPMINPFSAVNLLPGTMDTNQSVWSFDATVPTELSIESNVALTDPVNIPLDVSELLVEQSWNHHQVDASSLVESVQAALQAHVQNSMLKLEHASHYRLVNEFCTMSPNAVALAGLKSLQAILEGSTILSSIDAICFAHLVYSLSLVIHEQDAPSRFKELFTQARSYMSYVLPQDASEYLYVVDTLWEPNYDHDGFVTSRGQPFAGSQAAGMSDMSENMRGKQPQDYLMTSPNEFLSVSQHFLDELEYSVWNGANRVEVVASDLNAQHLSDQNLPAPPDSPLFHAMTYMIKRLLSEYGNAPDFVKSLRSMLDRLDSNFSVRRLELELLHAGRMFLPPALFFDRYMASVRIHIDSLHAQTQFGPLDRTHYYLKGIKLMQTLIHGPMLTPTTGWETTMAPTETTFGPLDQYMNSTTPNLGNTPELALGPGPATHSMDNSPAATTMPGMSLNTSTLSPTPYLTNANVVVTPARRSSAAATAMTPPSPATSSSPAKFIEADMSCDQCGYRPKGDPKWFGGSMAKHKKLQHATSPPKIYSCPYPGCTSQYKNRPDNLRQHQLDKGHFVDGHDEGSRRPSKRKRTK